MQNPKPQDIQAVENVLKNTAPQKKPAKFSDRFVNTIDRLTGGFDDILGFPDTDITVDEKGDLKPKGNSR